MRWTFGSTGPSANGEHLVGRFVHDRAAQRRATREQPPKRVDYLLRYTRDFPLAVVEAKACYKSAMDAVQQARSYAEMLDLKYAYEGWDPANAPLWVEFCE